MAPVTTAIDALSFFYPIGNTPAVDFTQELTPETDGRLLLLGCGDVRNVLYTVYANSRARNVLVLSLLVESDANHDPVSLWNIYYHFWIRKDDFNILKRQARYLMKLSSSLVDWENGPYFEFLTFHDERTLAEIRRVWKSYCEDTTHHHEKILKSRIEQAKNASKRLVGEGIALTGLRSAAPLATKAFQDVPEANKHYWQYGTLPVFPGIERASDTPNPTFASTLTATSILHYGIDPLLGYHLSAAYLDLEPKPPASKAVDADTNLKRISRAAFEQFAAWTAAYRSSRARVTIEVVVGDALQSCSTLCMLDANDDARETLQKRRDFNVIDSSNLIDHLGSVNLLMYTAPLLSKEPQSSLYTDTLVRRESDLKHTFADLLHGDFASMSLLFGLWPVEYWTNASFVAPDEALMDFVMKQFQKDESNHCGQAYCRILWKQRNSEMKTAVSADPQNLTLFLFNLYQKTFAHEEVENALASLLKNSAFTVSKMHRGSFANLLVFLKSRVLSDWDAVVQSLLAMIIREAGMMGQNHLQELFVQMHLAGLVASDLMLQPSTVRHYFPAKASLRGRQNLPAALCVTLEIPVSKLKVFTDLVSRPDKLGAPLVHGIVESSSSYEGPSWMNYFAAVQLCFGSLVFDHELDTLDQRLTIMPDDRNWSTTSSPLLASFMVPSGLLLLEPDNAIVALGLQVNKQMPVIELEFDTDHRLKSLTSHLEIAPGPTLDMLRDAAKVTTSQEGPFAIGVVISKSSRNFDFIIEFPVPVNVSKATLRIARKSAYVEVCVGINPLAAGKEQDRVLTSFPRYSECSSNISRFHIDLQPRLHLSQDLQWLIPHISMQMSDSERTLRDTFMHRSVHCPSARVNFKDSILSLFMHYTGLQGQKADVFGLSVPGAGGIHILILVSSLRFDMGNHTIFADSAILPLTASKMQQLSHN
ncbi:MAG: hypothetical protein Q9162_006741 [Coniocarpon cinnabarinum]